MPDTNPEETPAEAPTPPVDNSLEERVAQLAEIVAQQGQAIIELSERPILTGVTLQAPAPPDVPAPCRMVLYHRSGMQFPAVVVDVHRSGACDLIVLGMDGPAVRRPSVMQGEDGALLNQRWTWPPRVQPPELEDDEGASEE